MFFKFLIFIFVIIIPEKHGGFLFESNTNLIQRQLDSPSVIKIQDGNNPLECSQRVQEYRETYDEVNGTRNKIFGVKPPPLDIKILNWRISAC